MEEEYSDGHLSPVILAIQNIYDHPSRNLSPDLISHFISVLPLPCAVDGQNCIVESDGLPNSFEHSFWKFTPSELRLYRLSNKHHWTQHELREVITLIRDPTFTARDIGPDLESRVRPIQFVTFEYEIYLFRKMFLRNTIRKNLSRTLRDTNESISY